MIERCELCREEIRWGDIAVSRRRRGGVHNDCVLALWTTGREPRGNP